MEVEVQRDHARRAEPVKPVLLRCVFPFLQEVHVGLRRFARSNTASI